MRQVVLDTETTGLEPSRGHRIIEIGCVEMVNRRITGNNFHVYLNPDREIDDGAIEVHGITNEFLEDKPRFQEVVDDFLNYLGEAELIIHNAPFDVGFINHELQLARNAVTRVEEQCKILDTLVLARQMHPGQKNSLDALCKRYDIDNSQRDLHGALLDSEILADVYLAMTGGQTALSLSNRDDYLTQRNPGEIRRVSANRPPLKVIPANETELQAHEDKLQAIRKACGGDALFDQQSN